jgi:hypothetical protein
MSRNHLAFAIGLCFACAIGTTATQAAGPTADYKIYAEHTVTSPDKTTTVEQYAKINADGDYAWQLWARHQDQLTLLKPEQPDYPAGFRFTNDSQWLVRVQKTGSGEASLYLYHLGPQGFVAATQSRSVTWLGPISGAFQTPERSGGRISTSRRVSCKEPTIIIARWVRRGPIAGTSSSTCGVSCYPMASTAKFY